MNISPLSTPVPVQRAAAPTPAAVPASAEVATALEQVALVTANFADGLVLRDVMNDWFGFLGGRPGQVILLDNASDENTQQAAFDCYREGLIDKLLLVRRGHPDGHKSVSYLAEHTAPAIATKPYLLFFKIDCLPYRKGHADWLPEALRLLERDDAFAVGGSFNVDSRHHDGPMPGWYFSDKCSENFALMKRSMFIDALEAYAGQYVSSGFRGDPPTRSRAEDHYMIELAFEAHMARTGRYTLVRTEDPTWTVFHTNVHNERLQRVRQDYLARRDVDKFMNAARFTAKFPHGVYYGRPPTHPWHVRVRVAFGQSRLGAVWQGIKRQLRGGTTA